MLCKKHKSAIICQFPNFQIKSKIAAFDLDGTLIDTKSNSRFPVNAHDWVLKFPNIKEKLSGLNNHAIIIFTNQSGISLKNNVTKKRNSILKKIYLIKKELGISFEVYIATAKDSFRKPQVDMWHLFSKIHRDVDIDIANSFFVGDAAGRDSDFSASDRQFASNIGIKFYTPEEYFLNTPIAEYTTDTRNNITDQHKILNKLSITCEMIIMVGPPASGKTTICQKYLIPNDYVHINRDTLKTKIKCLKKTDESIRCGLSCVIDNTNPSIKARKEYIDIAKKYDTKVKCFIMTTPQNIAQELNAKRNTTKKVPVIAYHMYNKNYSQPSISEGIDEIHNITL